MNIEGVLTGGCSTSPTRHRVQVEARRTIGSVWGLQPELCWHEVEVSMDIDRPTRSKARSVANFRFDDLMKRSGRARR